MHKKHKTQIKTPNLRRIESPVVYLPLKKKRKKKKQRFTWKGKKALIILNWNEKQQIMAENKLSERKITCSTIANDYKLEARIIDGLLVRQSLKVFKRKIEMHKQESAFSATKQKERRRSKKENAKFGRKCDRRLTIFEFASRVGVAQRTNESVRGNREGFQNLWWVYIWGAPWLWDPSVFSLRFKRTQLFKPSD